MMKQQAEEIHVFDGTYCPKLPSPAAELNTMLTGD